MKGTNRTWRIIYAIQLELERGSQGEFRQLICQLDNQGQSATCRPIGKSRVIDLRIGDHVRKSEAVYEITNVSCFRDAFVTADYQLPTSEGYVIRTA